jgi:23S rRNA (pseudouridine1915-N3)-methyltransferase
MQLLLLAVGQRLPAWADAATAEFVKRFPPDLPLLLKTVKAEPRTQGKTVAQMMAAEAERLVAATPRGACRVVLDERGERQTTAHWPSACAAGNTTAATWCSTWAAPTDWRPS